MIRVLGRLSGKWGRQLAIVAAACVGFLLISLYGPAYDVTGVESATDADSEAKTMSLLSEEIGEALSISEASAHKGSRAHNKKHKKHRRLAAATGAPAPTTGATTPTTDITLGIWNQGFPWRMTNHDNYVAEVGNEPKLVLWYQSWGPNTEGEFCTSCADSLHNEGYTQVLTWMSKDYTRQPEYDQPEYSLKSIIDGDHDDYIRRYAKKIATWDKPIMLRFNHEMNGDWYPWGADVNGNKSGEYVDAWKHVHDIFQEEQATNVEWVWSPNVKKPVYNDTTPFSEYYPGDDYVDWVALDGYNLGTSKSWSSWYSLAEVFGPSYQEITGLTDKPLMIAETASSETGGDKAAWIRDGFLRDIPQKLPKVKAAIYFNQDEASNYRLSSSSQALEAFKGVAASSTYQGTIAQ